MVSGVFDLMSDPNTTLFAGHADSWWDPRGSMRPLHALNPARTRYIASRIDLAGRRVLDLGCGGGLLSEAMAQRGAEVTGVDTVAELIDTTRNHAHQSDLSIHYIHGSSATLLAEGEASFDVVTCLEMLEHVDDPGAIVDDCARLLKPGGDVVFSTLNRSAPAYLLAILGAEYLTGLLPRGTHDYDQFIRPAELAACCRGSGLEIADISGLAYVPWLEQAFITRSTAVNYLVHARRSA